MTSRAERGEDADPAGSRGAARDPLRELRVAVDALADQAVADLTDAELGTDLARLARQADRLQALLAERVRAAHRRGIGLEDGARSTTAWVARETGLARPAVARLRRAADLVELLPATGDAWRAGEIATTAVEMIAAARVPGHDEELRAVEAEWLDWARRGDHPSLRILTRHFASCGRADGSAPDAPDGLSLAEVGDRHELRGDFAPAAAETIHAALDAFTLPPAPDDGTSAPQRRAEALVRICEVALARGPGTDGARPTVSYLTHARVDGDPVAPLTFGTFAGVIPPGDRDRLLCDATLVPVATDHDGDPLDVGRATSVWPARIRRAIVARDRHCRWPGCDLPAPWCDAHHVRHWEHGGTTSVDNGLLLCRRHHTFLHAHPRWTFTFHRQRFRVHRPDGTELSRDPWAGGRAA